MPGETPTTDHRGRRTTALAALGFTLVLAGVLGYFLVVVFLGTRLPRIRNDAVPNWLLVAGGLLLSAVALGRVSSGRRLGPAILLGLGIVAAGAFAVMLYVVSVVPDAQGPAIGAAAPDFALPDQTGKTVRLADFAGKPLLLVFYRGHW